MTEPMTMERNDRVFSLRASSSRREEALDPGLCQTNNRLQINPWIALAWVPSWPPWWFAWLAAQHPGL